MDEIIVVRHPCLVKDDQKALEMLGGLKQVEKTFNQNNMRLQLNFRTANDSYAKGIFGSRKSVDGFWIKVQEFRNRRTGEVVFRTKFIGFVRECYEFTGMCDYQYLPSVDGKDIRPSLQITDVPDTLDEFLSRDCENLVLLPQVFTRIDTPYLQPFKPADSKPKTKTSSSEHQTLRKSRTNYVTFIRLLAPPNGDPVPSKASPDALKVFNAAQDLLDLKEKLKEVFSRRPVWTGNALCHELQTDRSRFKTIITGIAYYVNLGPFRMCWIRYGYDPRKEPTSKVYQTLDFRLPHRCGANFSKTTSHVVPALISSSQLKTGVEPGKGNSDEKIQEKRMLKCNFIPGRLPPVKQLFYHLCDIHLESVQIIVNRNDGLESSFTDTDGWCAVGTMRHIRDYLTADCKNTAEKMGPLMRKIDDDDEEEDETLELVEGEGDEEMDEDVEAEDEDDA